MLKLCLAIVGATVSPYTAAFLPVLSFCSRLVGTSFSLLPALVSSEVLFYSVLSLFMSGFIGPWRSWYPIPIWNSSEFSSCVVYLVPLEIG